MSYAQRRKDIQGHFAALFSGVPSDRIAWDGVAFQVPADRRPWVRFSLQNGSSLYADIGRDRRARRSGIVFVQVFTPDDSTTADAADLVDRAVAVFETRLLAGVTFESPRVSEVGPSDGWFQVNVAAPFWYDDMVTAT